MMQRYIPVVRMEASEDGYVSYSDVISLEAKNSALKMKVVELETKVFSLESTVNRLEHEIELF